MLYCLTLLIKLFNYIGFMALEICFLRGSVFLLSAVALGLSV